MVSKMMIHPSTDQWMCQDLLSSMSAVAFFYTAGHTQAYGDIMLRRTFSWVSLAAVAVLEQIMKATDCLNITAEKLHF